MMNKIFLFLLLSVPSFIFGQSASRWFDMYSYLNVKNIQISNDKIYANAKNSVFTYDINGGEMKKISSIDGISANDIEQIYYHSSLKKLFVSHQNGLIETIDEQKKVHKSPDLLYNTSISEDRKKINDFCVRGNLIYLATGYGITIYNVETNEFGDTYYIGDGGDLINVHSIRIHNNHIYAATDNGIRFADMNDFLIDFNNWHSMDSGVWKFLAVFNNKVLGIKNNNIYEIGNNIVHEVLPLHAVVVDFKESTGHLNVAFKHQVKLFDSNYILINTFGNTNTYNFTALTAVSDRDKVYVGTKEIGILSTPINNLQYSEIHPNCPLYNHPFDVDAKNGNIWVVYGAHSSYFNPYPLKQYGVSNYKDGTWTNIPYRNLNVKSISSVAIHPSDPNTVYLGSAFRGLIKIQDYNITVYDENNSGLESFVYVVPESGEHIVNVRVFKMMFDKENNLWLTQGLVGGVVKVLKNDNTWQSYDYHDVINNPSDYLGCSAVDFDQEGNFWIGSERMGAFVLDPRTQHKKILTKGIAFDGAYKFVSALAIDKDGVLWIGAVKGLRILHNPEHIFENPNIEAVPIKIVYEGVVQLLMENQYISHIAVDGSNNKWIGTIDNGVYYFSENGQQTIYHFTKENSPLPSNVIYDIAVDGSTGMVYFSTSKGLIGFKGIATETGENMDDVYAFPNPVNLQKHDFVTIRGLVEKVSVKIVDVEGNLVYETTSKGGSITWDLTAFGKYKVASGVYIALITDEDGSKTQVTKILVIK